MKNVLRIVAGLLGFFFLINGIQWIVNPASIAEQLGMPLLEGAGLSTQIGDIGSFFITVGVMTLVGVITTTRHWFYAPSMLLLIAAIYRTLNFNLRCTIRNVSNCCRGSCRSIFNLCWFADFNTRLKL